MSLTAPNPKYNSTSWINRPGASLGKFLFIECNEKVGQQVVLDWFVMLHAYMMVIILIESGRQQNRSFTGGLNLSRKLASLFIPLLLLCSGGSVIFSIGLFLILSVKQKNRIRNQSVGSINSNRNNNIPESDIDPLHVLVAWVSVVLLAWEYENAFKKPDVKSPEGQVLVLGTSTLSQYQHGFITIEEASSIAWLRLLLIPCLPSLLLLIVPSNFLSNTGPNRKPIIAMICHGAILVLFLMIGTVAFTFHHEGFSKLDERHSREMKHVQPGEQEIPALKMLIRDVLETAPARFLLVDFAHALIACVIMTIHLDHSAPFLVMVVLSIIGPGGTFCLLSAINEYSVARQGNIEYFVKTKAELRHNGRKND
jgi:hypothetical protein